MKIILSLFTIFLLLLVGCTHPAPQDSQKTEATTEILGPDSVQEETTEPFSHQAPIELIEGPTKTPYINKVLLETVERITTPDMTEYEKAKAAFDYLIELTYFEKPIALDIWRIRGGGEKPSYVENKCLSVLLYGLGECEDYAAALAMLLRTMGMKAEYVPGLTYSAEGPLVDHAWTVAEIDGVWYHLDSQLQDNVSRNRSISYRYFMKGDETMAASHYWGQNLIDAKFLTEEQNQEIRNHFLYPPCPRDYPTPQRRNYTPLPQTDAGKVLNQVAAEKAEYERLNGPLPPLELDTTPPVFGWEGYGPPD